MQNLPKVNLGQSTFQDTFFVAGSQLTPYRTLRQLQLQINELEVSLKKADINKRRTLLKISKLDPDDPEQALDIEEFTFDLEQQVALIEDAETRLNHFKLLIEGLMKDVPQSYWDQGFEQAEVEHWTKHFAKQLAISRMTGLPDKQLVEQMMLLPDSMVQDVMKLSNETSNRYLSSNIQAETPVAMLESPQPNYRPK